MEFSLDMNIKLGEKNHKHIMKSNNAKGGIEP